ncbi:MAG: LicD family protein [Candidatus Saccharibacteria bacterium]|nr:LicD family protein [Candidatus Saccharibacteria bacterium]
MKSKTILNPKFNLNAEEICGYKVSAKMKKVWAKELEMLEKFQEVCNKHNLKWFLIGGSLLGAIRHNGFIPWDDDIDIAMFRDDYKKLIKIAPKEFTQPFFFQTPYTDKVYRGHAQLRYDGTTAILPEEINRSHHQGIFIDIFPFDEYPDTKHGWNKQAYQVREIQCLYEDYFNEYFPTETLKKEHIRAIIIVKLFGFKNIYRRYERVCARFNGRGNGRIGNLSLVYGSRVQEKVFFDKIIMHPFEYLQVPIPADYDKLLKNKFGNYMEFVKGSSAHGKVIFDPDKPYQETLLKLRKELK